MNLDQVRAGVIADATVNGYIAGRFFYRNPIQEQAGSYIVLLRNLLTRNMVREDNQMQFMLFAKTGDELDALSKALITFFEGRHTLGNEVYYKIYFIAQNDVLGKLQNGFYFNIQTYGFRKTT